MELTQEQINNLYSIVIEEVQKVRYDKDFMNVLSSICNVYGVESTKEDSRYKILGDEIVKHYVMNNDWPDDKLFISILDIKHEDKLLRFIQEIINIEKEVSVDTINRINQNLPHDSEFKLGKDELYVFSKKGEVLRQLVNNDIPFYKCKAKFSYGTVSIEESSIPGNIADKSFLLAFNDTWNDYSIYSFFVLYFRENGENKKIGEVKIIKKGEEKNTNDVLGDVFYYLSNEFCSLGQNVLYYSKMYELFGDNSYKYLRALCDSAVFSKIYEGFRSDRMFSESLQRFNEAEQALRVGRYIINGRKVDDAYAFTYSYKPNYANDDFNNINISFQFKNQCNPYERVYGLIGENGVGKTTLLKNIIYSLTNNSKENGFDGLVPIFSQVMVISYSPFDSFPITEQGARIDYLYCGLFEHENIIQSKGTQIQRLKNNILTINKRNSIQNPLCENWCQIMGEMFPENIIKSFYVSRDGTIELKDDVICQMCDKMSSGETIFIYSITDIIANIRRDTLLLFDEPEQHLHPHGIMQLIRAIFTILEKYESYAIIATHSTLVIREMQSKNVYIFNREEDYLHIAKIGIESFGEDIAILNDVVFKNRSENKPFEKCIYDLAKKYKNYDDVVKELQNEHNELSLNTRLFIQSALKN